MSAGEQCAWFCRVEELAVDNLEFGHVSSIPGRVLNRFSKDTGFMDDLLPFSFCEFMQVRGKGTKRMRGKREGGIKKNGRE